MSPKKSPLTADAHRVFTEITRQWNIDWPMVALNAEHFGQLSQEQHMNDGINAFAMRTKEFAWNEMIRIATAAQTDDNVNSNILILLGGVAVLVREAAALYTSTARIHFSRTGQSYGALTEENVIASMFLLTLAMAVEDNDYNSSDDDDDDDRNNDQPRDTGENA